MQITQFPLGTRLSVLWRSFFIQALWNFKSLLSVGFTFSLLPAARKLYPDSGERINFLRRQLAFFNAHPYVAPFAIGAVLRLEMDGHPPEKVDRFRDALIGPMGSMGDQLFWATIRPAVMLFGIALLRVFEPWLNTFAALIIVLLVYNIPNIYMRWHSLNKGFELGYRLIKELKIENYERLLLRYRILGLVSFVIFLAELLERTVETDILHTLVFMLSMGLTFYIRRRWSLIYTPVLLSLLAAFILGLIKFL